MPLERELSSPPPRSQRLPGVRTSLTRLISRRHRGCTGGHLVFLYGGYGGNENNFEKFKYYYDLPNGWTADTINKTEKSTNGTDTKWSNQTARGEGVLRVTTTTG